VWESLRCYKVGAPESKALINNKTTHNDMYTRLKHRRRWCDNGQFITPSQTILSRTTDIPSLICGAVNHLSACGQMVPLALTTATIYTRLLECFFHSSSFNSRSHIDSNPDGILVKFFERLWSYEYRSYAWACILSASLSPLLLPAPTNTPHLPFIRWRGAGLRFYPLRTNDKSAASFSLRRVRNTHGVAPT